MADSASKNTSGIDFQSPTSVLKTELFHAQRQGRIVRIELLKPHRVMSTDTGQSENVRFLVNHQSMEASGDSDNFSRQIKLGSQGYKQWLAERIGVDADVMAMMGTAAQPGKMAWHSEQFEDLTVTSFVTAGVKGNAMRAGEPTRWHQTPEGNKPITAQLPNDVTSTTDHQVASVETESNADFMEDELVGDYLGTINITVLINQPVHQGALMKLMMLATEAKSSALAQLAVSSRFTSHLATGTGTDQLMMAALNQPGIFERDSGSGHLKLGELTATSVRKAVLKALAWQNQLTPEKTGSALYALARFGFTEEIVRQGVIQHLTEKQAHLFDANWRSVNHYPRLVAVSYAYAQVLDRIRYGSISSDAAPEILRDLAAQFSVAVSERPERWSIYWQALEVPSLDQLTLSDNQFIAQRELILRAIARGWSDKWPD